MLVIDNVDFFPFFIFLYFVIDLYAVNIRYCNYNILTIILNLIDIRILEDIHFFSCWKFTNKLKRSVKISAACFEVFSVEGEVTVFHSHYDALQLLLDLAEGFGRGSGGTRQL